MCEGPLQHINLCLIKTAVCCPHRSWCSVAWSGPWPCGGIYQTLRQACSRPIKVFITPERSLEVNVQAPKRAICALLCALVHDAKVTLGVGSSQLLSFDISLSWRGGGVCYEDCPRKNLSIFLPTFHRWSWSAGEYFLVPKAQIHIHGYVISETVLE